MTSRDGRICSVPDFAPPPDAAVVVGALVPAVPAAVELPYVVAAINTSSTQAVRKILCDVDDLILVDGL